LSVLADLGFSGAEHSRSQK